MTGPIDDRLRDQGLNRLWAAAHRYATSHRRNGNWGSVKIPNLTNDERAALNRRLHRTAHGQSVIVDLAALDTWLADTHQTSLLAVVEAIVGPVTNSHDTAIAEGASRRQFLDSVAAHPTTDEAINTWAATHAGRLHRREFAPVAAALDVMADLRSRPGQVRCLDVVAGQVLADSHALDPETPAGQLLVGILAACEGTLPPTGASQTRALLNRSGISTDEVSSHVLCVNIPGLPATSVPRRVTLAELANENIGAATDTTEVWAVENPTALQTLARLANLACPPLVSVDGQPHIAAQQLLVRLADSGATIRYHSDLGAGGVAITNLVLRLHPNIEPWRMLTDDYLEAIERTGGRGPKINATVPEASWDPKLASVMNDRRIEIEEQQVLDLLINDLTSK